MNKGLPLDGQGQSRIYLEDAIKAAAGKVSAIPVFAVSMGVEGKGCG